MARPRKRDLNEEEWEAIEGKGDRTASGIVSAMRGAGLGSISQIEASRRRVSHEWVAQQRKRRRLMNGLRQNIEPSRNLPENRGAMPSDNSKVTWYSDSRLPSVQKQGEIAERPSDTAAKPSGIKVESEQGAKA